MRRHVLMDPDQIRAKLDRDHDGRHEESLQHLRIAIARMGPDLQEVVKLRWMDGRSRIEVARLLACRVWDVWLLERRARLFLRSELAA